MRLLLLISSFTTHSFWLYLLSHRPSLNVDFWSTFVALILRILFFGYATRLGCTAGGLTCIVVGTLAILVLELVLSQGGIMSTTMFKCRWCLEYLLSPFRFRSSSIIHYFFSTRPPFHPTISPPMSKKQTIHAALRSCEAAGSLNTCIEQSELLDYQAASIRARYRFFCTDIW